MKCRECQILIFRYKSIWPYWFQWLIVSPKRSNNEIFFCTRKDVWSRWISTDLLHSHSYWRYSKNITKTVWPVIKSVNESIPEPNQWPDMTCRPSDRDAIINYSTQYSIKIVRRQSKAVQFGRRIFVIAKSFAVVFHIGMQLRCSSAASDWQ